MRNPRQKNLSRAETVLSNKELLSSTNYQPKTHILAAAKGLDVHAYFLDNLSVDTGRAGQTYQLVKKLGFGPLVKDLLLAVQDNHVLVLERL